MAVGFFGSFFLAGIVLGSITVTRIGDIYGRRPGFIFGLIIQSSVTLAFLFTTSHYYAYAFCFIIGFGVTGKQYVGWAYLLEMQPSNKSVMVGTLEFIFEGLLFIFVTFYFGWISKTWYYMQIPTVTFGVIGIIFLILQPESPKYLVSIKKYDEARRSFNKIAKVNGKAGNIADSFVFPKEEAHGNSFLEHVAEESDQDSKNQNAIESTNVKELCRNARTRSNLTFSSVIWCALIVNYYIVAFYLKYFPGNIF